MREGMRRAICAIYVQRWEDRLCYRKHNGFAIAVSNTLHKDMGKWNPYQSKSRRRWPEPTPASLLCRP